MRVSRLALDDFRGCAHVELPLARGAVAFIGPNGAGKTNLLEAIHLVARGDSPRARDDTEMVRWGAATARVRTEVDRAEDHRRIEMLLFAPPEGERRRPRRYLLDGAGKRAEDAVGELVVVEWLFAWTGLGRLLAQTLVPPLQTNSAETLLFLDPQIVSIILTIFGGLFLIADLLASVAIRSADPRLRET